MPSAIRAEVESDIVGLHCGYHCGGFVHGGGHRLFGVNGFRAVICGVDDNLGAMLRLRCNADDVRLRFLQHFPIVGILIRFRHVVAIAEVLHHVWTQVCACDEGCPFFGEEAGGVRIRQADCLVIRDFVVNKCAHPATADDSGAIGFHRYVLLRDWGMLLSYISGRCALQARPGAWLAFTSTGAVPLMRCYKPRLLGLKNLFATSVMKFCPIARYPSALGCKSSGSRCAKSAPNTSRPLT